MFVIVRTLVHDVACRIADFHAMSEEFDLFVEIMLFQDAHHMRYRGSRDGVVSLYVAFFRIRSEWFECMMAREHPLVSGNVWIRAGLLRCHDVDGMVFVYSDFKVVEVLDDVRRPSRMVVGFAFMEVV